MKNKTDGISKSLFWGVLVVLIILIGGLGFVVFSMKKDVSKFEKAIKELKEEKNNNVTEEVSDAKENKCSKLNGKYYGELTNDIVNMKQTYIFNEDGSYIVNVENGGGSSGMYKVIGNKIFFFQTAQIGPSRDISAYYFEIDDNCQKIYAYSDGSEYTLEKQDA